MEAQHVQAIVLGYSPHSEYSEEIMRRRIVLGVIVDTKLAGWGQAILDKVRTGSNEFFGPTWTSSRSK